MMSKRGLPRRLFLRHWQVNKQTHSTCTTLFVLPIAPSAQNSHSAVHHCPTCLFHPTILRALSTMTFRPSNSSRARPYQSRLPTVPTIPLLKKRPAYRPATAVESTPPLPSQKTIMPFHLTTSSSSPCSATASPLRRPIPPTFPSN